MTALGETGAPTPVAATRLRAPESLMGPVDGAELDRAVRESASTGVMHRLWIASRRTRS
ncbi:uncharacterized protein DUF853 [Streptomyces sp. BK340]|nr:uncharacterized protein DUF853 [Streptomyces sp. BK340]